MALNRLGRHQDAAARMRVALKIDASNEQAYAHLMEALLRLGLHEEVELTFYLAQDALTEPSPRCLATMGESLLQRKVYQRSEWCLREALRLEPGLLRVRARLGSILAATGKPQRALQMFRRELREDPGNIDTLLDLGELLVELNRLPEAGEKFRRVLELDPANVDAHYWLGRIAMRCRRFEQAQLEFELVIRLDSEFPGVRVWLAEAMIQRGNNDRARLLLGEERDLVIRELEGLSDSAAKQACDAADLARLANLMLSAEAFAQAAETMMLMIRGEGESAQLWRKIAYAWFRAGQRERGCHASRRALRLDPVCTVSIYNLALAAMEDRRDRQARIWIRRGLKINRRDDALRRLRLRHWVMRIARRLRIV
jgi:tetratricopeptide (TPR) repeat protein